MHIALVIPDIEPDREGNSRMGTILLIVLILLLLGSVPTYPHSRNWGYGPSGFVGLLLVVLIVLLLMGTVPWGWTTTPVVVPPR